MSFHRVIQILSTKTYADPRFTARVFCANVRAAASQSPRAAAYYVNVRREMGEDVFDAVSRYQGTRTQDAVAANFLQSRRLYLRRRGFFGW